MTVLYFNLFYKLTFLGEIRFLCSLSYTNFTGSEFGGQVPLLPIAHTRAMHTYTRCTLMHRCMYTHLCPSVCGQGQTLNPLSAVAAEPKGLGLSQATSPDCLGPSGQNSHKGLCPGVSSRHTCNAVPTVQ